MLYFCNAGKDRTGVVSALLLRQLGACRETVRADYMTSAVNLVQHLRAYMQEHPGVPPAVITPQKRDREEFLN